MLPLAAVLALSVDPEGAQEFGAAIVGLHAIGTLDCPVVVTEGVPLLPLLSVLVLSVDAYGDHDFVASFVSDLSKWNSAAEVNDVELL